MPIRTFNMRNVCHRATLRYGLAVIVTATGLQPAVAVESQVRFVPSGEKSVVARPEVIRVASARPSTSPQVAANVPRSAPAKDSPEYTQAMREAAALRNGLEFAAPNATPIAKEKAIAATASTTAPQRVSFMPAAPVVRPELRPAPSPVIRHMTPPVAVAQNRPKEVERVAPQPVYRELAPITPIPETVADAPREQVVPHGKIEPAPVVSSRRFATTSPSITSPPAIIASPTTPAAAPEVRPSIEPTITPAPPAIALIPKQPVAPISAPRSSPETTTLVIRNTPPTVAFAPTQHIEPISPPPSPPEGPTPGPATALAADTTMIAAPGTLPASPLACPYLPGQSGTQKICGVDCGPPGAPCCTGWDNAHCIPWSLFGPGEYVGPARTEHLSTYYLRVNDLITLTYINSRRKSAEQYRFGVGDRLRIESSVDETLDRELFVQPDGDITLPIVGEVTAAGKTVAELREDLLEVFRNVQRQPQITVTPLEVNAGLQEILDSVTSEIGSNGQAQDLRITPEGTINVPGLGSVYVQGLTLDELGAELEARYASAFGAGLLITPSLTERAPSYVFVGGEVRQPGRLTLDGPTTVMQAISMAGGWNNGGNIHQIVVFRRDENWCLKATKIDLHAPLYGKDPCPANDIWLRDNDLIIIPKSRILCAADIIDLYMTRGVYAAFPISFVRDLSSGSSFVPIPTGP